MLPVLRQLEVAVEVWEALLPAAASLFP